MVAHVYTTIEDPDAHGDIAVLAGLVAIGWQALAVVPLTPAADAFAVRCRAIGARVERTVAPSTAGVVRLAEAAWSISRRRTQLRAWRVAVVHAHDDGAAITWGWPARASGIPVVWDVQVDQSPTELDRARVAAASYVLEIGRGRRLAYLRRPPPRRNRSSSTGSDDDGGGDTLVIDLSHDPAAVRTRASTSSDVYTTLTGLRPEPVVGSGVSPSPMVRHDRLHSHGRPRADESTP